MSAHFDDACYGYWRCDNCGRTLSTAAASRVVPQLVHPWRVMHAEGFVGDFHVCRDRCETELRVKLEKQLQ